MGQDKTDVDDLNQRDAGHATGDSPPPWFASDDDKANGGRGSRPKPRAQGAHPSAVPEETSVQSRS
jgi:hypothetical protein